MSEVIQQPDWVKSAAEYAHINGEHHEADYLSKIAVAAAALLTREVGIEDYSDTKTIETTDSTMTNARNRTVVKSRLISLGNELSEDPFNFAQLTTELESTSFDVVKRRLILPPKVLTSHTTVPIVKSIEISKLSEKIENAPSAQELVEVPDSKFIYYPGFIDHRPHTSPSTSSPKNVYRIRSTRAIEFLGLIGELCQKTGVDISQLNIKTFNPDDPREII